MQNTELRSKIWNAKAVKRLAQRLAVLAAAELTRTSGPVRDPQFLSRVKRAVQGELTPQRMIPFVSEVMKSSLHLCHPRFAAQQVAAPVPVAALIESVVAALNNSVAIWEMSPSATVIDREVMNLFKRLFGFPMMAEGSSVPGGAFANLTALLAARARLEPTAWASGQGRIAILAGEQTHYSVSRAAGILGLGADSVFTIPTDVLHRTDTIRAPAVFRAARGAGFRKFILVATSGSTPTGSCDELESLARLAHREGAWLHVDAAHGGGLIFSRRYRHLLRGIERADSIAFDPHKMLFMPLCASAVMVREGRWLRRAFEQHAPYLFGGGKRAFPDIGQFTIACSQRFDALKTWLTWKAYSGALWDDLITGTCAVAHAAFEYCKQSRTLEPTHEPQTNIFCFGLRARPRSTKVSDRVHWAIKEKVNATGDAYISSTVLGGRRVLRIVVMNPRTTRNDIVEVLKVVERVAKQV
jgi:L-2,4-diaminobutyrate decarboxylase